MASGHQRRQWRRELSHQGRALDFIRPTWDLQQQLFITSTPSPSAVNASLPSPHHQNLPFLFIAHLFRVVCARDRAPAQRFADHNLAHL